MIRDTCVGVQALIAQVLQTFKVSSFYDNSFISKKLYRLNRSTRLKNVLSRFILEGNIEKYFCVSQ